VLPLVQHASSPISFPRITSVVMMGIFRLLNIHDPHCICVVFIAAVIVSGGGVGGCLFMLHTSYFCGIGISSGIRH
jgi:hypothetical protein